MGFLNFGNKNTLKNNIKNRKVCFAFVSGIDNLFTIENEVVNVTIDRLNGKLLIVSRLNKKRSASLALNKITDVRDVTDVQIKEVDKSVVGRAVVGGLLMGPLGSIIGGMSGIGGKKEVQSKHHFVIISYESNGASRQIVLEIVGASTGWKEFVAELPKDANSPFAQVTTSGPVEL